MVIALMKKINCKWNRNSEEMGKRKLNIIGLVRFIGNC